ncbi:hypothetical protein CALVIDRAFT_520007 [Calocera viscosa TUFC12733]|uniref:Bicarbonate transporter-like transmembrane domain-containing protein n=1 Tax=Calocera viscosa (strain TUFC12733) TaxID=1330018 RepID=A0A167IJF8_CALVF|nr:hypothetical protein CALVIDRAFT_520007 [Calocera viscosa TUFC12733]
MSRPTPTPGASRPTPLGSRLPSLLQTPQDTPLMSPTLPGTPLATDLYPPPSDPGLKLPTTTQEARASESSGTLSCPSPRALGSTAGYGQAGAKWWKCIGRGMYRDIRARAPYYWSDWRDAWNYRVIPATTMIFFSNVLPGIAFSLDLIETTNEYGVTEVLLSSFMASALFSLFGAQPLCILGVTGPITVLNSTIYRILQTAPSPPNYLQFVGWVYLWGALLHFLAALSGAVNFLSRVTRFSCDTFGFFVSVVYLQYGCQIILRQFSASSPQSALAALVLALLMLGISHLFLRLADSTLFARPPRRFLADYGMPLTLIATSGMGYWGSLRGVQTLPTGTSFQPAGGRAWVVPFWELEGKWVGIAFPFGVILFILFYFDHNVSSLIAQSSDFPLRKPPGFHWDFFLLGISTFLAGLLGLPAPNGLIPQAPIHTRSLLVLGPPKHEPETEEEKGGAERALGGPQGGVRPGREVPVGVVEQRVSNLAQGALCLVLLSPPFLHLLGLVPRGVLAGLFWYMGTDALFTSGVTAKALYLLTDRAHLSPHEPLQRVRRSRVLLFLLIELLGFGATFAIVQTIAAIGFPVVIFALVPIRLWVVPRLGFSEEEMRVLDGAVASPFTMASVGGSL